MTFLSFVSALRTTENAVKSGGWMILDAAETLFLTARDRVFANMEDKKTKKKKGDAEQDMFEENPKWTEIGKVVEEIKEELVSGAKDPAKETVLVVTRDERTSRQVNDFLTLGSQMVLGRLYNRCFGDKFGYLSKFGEDNEPRNIKEFKHKGQGKKSAERKTAEDNKENEPEEQKTLRTRFHALDSCESFDTFLLLEEVSPALARY